jgi:SAM-dependent methyltransferase
MITIKTEYPVALDSPDHIYPWGTIRDNTTNSIFIEEVEKYFNGKPIKFLDLGCSGGELAIDFMRKGHLSVGLEGSDISLKEKRANWTTYANDILFTCDISHPYTILNDALPIKFDCITAWEVIEHIHPDRLDVFFNNIIEHLLSDGVFIGSINLESDKHEEYELHQSVLSIDAWRDDILPKYFHTPYIEETIIHGGRSAPCIRNTKILPITSWVRHESQSMFIFMQNRKG